MISAGLLRRAKRNPRLFLGGAITAPQVGQNRLAAGIGWRQDMHRSATVAGLS
jgi:hypothetical protein